MTASAFRAELQKAHRRHDFLLCLLVPLILVLWVGGLSPTSPEELANGYSALFYSVPVIEAILLPVMMAVLASRLWDIEVKGSTAKLLYTLQSRRSLFAGKALFGALEVLLLTVLMLGPLPLLGKLHHYTEVFPFGQFVYLFICTLAVCLMLFFGGLAIRSRPSAPASSERWWGCSLPLCPRLSAILSPLAISSRWVPTRLPAGTVTPILSPTAPGPSTGACWLLRFFLR